MKNWMWLCLFLSLPIGAQQHSIELDTPTGEQLSFQYVGNGELWASFYLSDDIVAQFDANELIIVQLDDYKPIKLEQGLRSCGAPAGDAQQISYVFAKDDAEWRFQGFTQPRTDVLKLLGWDAGRYDKLVADRRAVVVDFPLGRDASIRNQLQGAKTIRFLYSTDDGHQHQVEFQLNNVAAKLRALH